MVDKIKTKLTPIRYPGGKSNALKYLNQYFIKDFSEYREPFFGGGSIGLYLMQYKKDAVYWINDLCFPVYCFWKVLYEYPQDMEKFLASKKLEYVVPNDKVGKIIDGKKVPSQSAEKGRALHEICRKLINESKNEFQTACLWYILNKLSYSGMAMIGSYAPLAWDQNFTDNCIANLHKTSELMHSVKNVRITHLDYNELLTPDSNDVFIFMDPPYDIQHNLYGNNGDMHEGFDHEKFGDKVKVCKHSWMITYNDNQIIKDRFTGYKQIPWDLTYTMKAAKRKEEDKADIKMKYEEGKIPEKSGRKGKELLILNYEV